MWGGRYVYCRESMIDWYKKARQHLSEMRRLEFIRDNCFQHPSYTTIDRDIESNKKLATICILRHERTLFVERVGRDSRETAEALVTRMIRSRSVPRETI